MVMNWVEGFLDKLPGPIKAVGGSPQLRFLTLVLIVVEVILAFVFGFTSGLHRTILILGMIIIPFCLIIIATIMIWKQPSEAEAGGVSTRFMEPPTATKRYAALFDGFSGCDFYAFNPPFQAEFVGKKQMKDALETHKKRYETGTTAQYLFFDRKSLGRGKKFWRMLESKLDKDKLNEALSIRFYDKEPYYPGYTYFIGRKGKDEEFCILYPTIAMREGLPQAVIVIEGPAGMYDIMLGHFKKYFDKAKEIKID